jgi:hypothetical protein
MITNKTISKMNSEVQKTETTLTIGSEVANLSELIAKSEGLAKLKPVMTLTADYIELEKPDDAFRGIYIGIGEINVTDKVTGELKAIESVRFIIDKQVKINAGVSLVRELKNVPVGTPLEVKYLRKDGNVKIYSVTLLA